MRKTSKHLIIHKDIKKRKSKNLINKYINIKYRLERLIV